MHLRHAPRKPKLEAMMIKRIALSLTFLLFPLSLGACGADDAALSGPADDEPTAAVAAPDADLSADGIGTSPSDPVAGKPIKPGTRWCAWPPSCTNPDAACCTAECVQIGDQTVCSND